MIKRFFRWLALRAALKDGITEAEFIEWEKRQEAAGKARELANAIRDSR